ncbi:hypothetical protein Hanom_Chr01g00042281 [Helianthus anomalus]
MDCRPWMVLSQDNTRLHRGRFWIIHHLQILDKYFFLHPSKQNRRKRPKHCLYKKGKNNINRSK